MTRYVIGDVQGCYDALMRLLKLIKFDPDQDQLWFAGDMVNRGGQSLETLRFVWRHRHACRAVLGNHDLHLLATAAGFAKRPSEELDRVLNADDAADLIDWVRHQPLLHPFRRRKTLICHAGLHPYWSIPQALSLAGELEDLLQSDSWQRKLKRIYGGKTSGWQDGLKGRERRRAVMATLTRMRYLSARGEFSSTEKGPPGSQPPHWYPWFDLPHQRESGWRVLFGHWATLGYHASRDVVCLDSGCVWGGRLTAVTLKNPDLPLQVE